MKKIILWAMMVVVSPLYALDPTAVKMKVYQFAVSTNRDCSNPVTLFSKTSPATVDMLVGPKLGGGKVPKGVYQCVIIKMSDLVSFIPATSSGNCTAGQEYTIDVCHTAGGGMSTTPIESDGTFSAESSCTGTPDNNTSFSENIVTLYLSTGSTHDPAVSGGSMNSFLKPADNSTTSGNGLKLQNAWIVSAFGAGKFVINATGKISSTSGGNCMMQPPIFAFRNGL